MARARNLKPSFFRDAALVELPVETRLLFAGLWTLADRKGRLEDKPKQIKMELYPADSFDVDAMLTELHGAELITRYEIEGKRFIQVRSFEKHQNPHRDEKESSIPAPCEHSASTVQAPCEHDGNRASTSNLQPISLIETLSGKPDVDPLPNGKAKFKSEATAILAFLNEKTGRNYRTVAANLDMIAARLKDGATTAECRQVIAKKSREWGTDEKMSEYLRPATLFNRTKFAQYQGELHVERTVE